MAGERPGVFSLGVLIECVPLLVAAAARRVSPAAEATVAAVLLGMLVVTWDFSRTFSPRTGFAGAFFFLRPAIMYTVWLPTGTRVESALGNTCLMRLLKSLLLMMLVCPNSEQQRM